MRKRKVVYPPPKTDSKGGSISASIAAARAAAADRSVTINLDAISGRSGIIKGSRARIASGLYAGEIAVVESVVGGVIPAALVRTEAGKTRRVRTVDLIPVGAGESSPSS
ncbi:MAG TPA: hypothetical protein VKC59_06670 [Candidatus Limnocylindrales bacterium]|nr:hypothetical protein [Candidatus Limnocylindrales bacterium]